MLDPAAVPDALAYFTSEYEADLFANRYRDTPNELTWEDRWSKVAYAVAATGVAVDEEIEPSLPGYADREYARRSDNYYRMMESGAALPSSPQQWNYGSTRPYPKAGSSCYTVAIEDSLAAFEQADHDATTIFVSSGGAGFLFDGIRPRGCRVRRSVSACVGVMGHGGPLRRLESRTGYITNGGRERGAMMAQLSASHPDVIEFVLAKVPWRIADGAALAESLALYDAALATVQRPVSEPRSRLEAAQDACAQAVGEVESRLNAGHTLASRAKQIAARASWVVPLQNCNMSVRVPDALMHAAVRDLPWVLSWFSDDAPKPGEQPNVSVDGEDADPTTVLYADDGFVQVLPNTTGNLRRYGVVLTTWEAVKDNLRPNPNNWKDQEYAAFHRNVLMPWLAKYNGPIMARDLLGLIYEAAHNHADPGIVFSDTYERYSPVDSAIYGYRYSNPCSEYVNTKDGSCNLASINLRWCVEEARRAHSMIVAQHGVAGALEDAILHVVRKQTERLTRYMNDALEHNEAPVPSIDHHSHNVYRTIGVGMMGLAEACILTRQRYGSEEAQRFAALLESEIALTAWETSFRQAMKEGRKKPEAWNRDRMVAIFRLREGSASDYDLPESHMVRWAALAARTRAGDYATNTCVTSIAPTGTIAQVAGWTMSRALTNGHVPEIAVTSGPEPVFAAGHTRKDNSGTVRVRHDLFPADRAAWKAWHVTAADVTPEAHVQMQAALAAFCCMSVSKTVNLPNDATVEDVRNAYMLAWTLGVPGTTVYRDGSKPMQVLTADCPGGECEIVAVGQEEGIALSRADARA